MALVPCLRLDLYSVFTPERPRSTLKCVPIYVIENVKSYLTVPAKSSVHMVVLISSN